MDMKRIGLLMVCMMVMAVFTANAKDGESETYRYELEALDGVAALSSKVPPLVPVLA